MKQKREGDLRASNLNRLPWSTYHSLLSSPRPRAKAGTP